MENFSVIEPENLQFYFGFRDDLNNFRFQTEVGKTKTRKGEAPGNFFSPIHVNKCVCPSQCESRWNWLNSFFFYLLFFFVIIFEWNQIKLQTIRRTDRQSVWQRQWEWNVVGGLIFSLHQGPPLTFSTSFYSFIYLLSQHRYIWQCSVGIK